MRIEPQWIISSGNIRAICLISLIIFCYSAPSSRAGQTPGKVLCRPELTPSRRVELAAQLRKITGWKNLTFDENGILRLGDSTPEGGSQTARKLLADAVAGKNMMLLEDASNQRDVTFCRVIKGRWKKEAADDPPVFIIQIDFEDFSHLMGDKPALDAFNIGWGALHEIAHVIKDSEDPSREGEAGECESLINIMRRECGLAERAEYFFTLLPGTMNSDFMTRFVRMAFEQYNPDRSRTKRYWLIWDASLVGGIDEQKL